MTIKTNTSKKTRDGLPTTRNSGSHTCAVHMFSTDTEVDLPYTPAYDKANKGKKKKEELQ
jgi:hypothetical protein